MTREVHKEGSKAHDQHASDGDHAAANSKLSGQAWSKDSVAAPAPAEGAKHELPSVTLTDKQNPAPKGPPEANSLLLAAADESVNKSIYKLPKWVGMENPPADLGCVSSFSNRYRDVLQKAGIIDSNDDSKFRGLYQVNLDQMNKVMGKAHLLEKIGTKDVKEGDVIEGVTPDSSKRHVGIVGGIENGHRMVYDNVSGTWTKEVLDQRFGQYKQNNYYRAFLPTK